MFQHAQHLALAGLSRVQIVSGCGAISACAFSFSARRTARIIKADAAGRRTFAVKPDALRLRAVPAEVLGKRHFDRSH
jgi:hypothetical protein